MMSDTVCAVDVGSTSIKAVVYDRRLQERARVHHPLPAVRDKCRAESDPEAVWNAFTTAVRGAVETSAHTPTALVICAQMAGLVLLDRRRRPLGPIILGVDRRGSVDRASSEPRTGCPPGGIYPKQKLQWLTAHEPQRIRDTHWLGGVKEYLLLYLTDQWLTDPASASATALFDLPTSRWSVDAVEQAGVRVDMLPEIAECTAIAGLTTDPASKACGLDDPIPVRVGIGDGPAANLSCGAVGEERLALSLGTTVVARLMVREVSATSDELPSFVQRVDDQWHCVGIRFDADDHGRYTPIGRPDVRVSLNRLPEVVSTNLAAYQPRELRPTGSRCQDPHVLDELATNWDVPVVATAAYDGTRGTAALAHTAPGEFRPTDLARQIAEVSSSR